MGKGEITCAQAFCLLSMDISRSRKAFLRIFNEVCASFRTVAASRSS